METNQSDYVTMVSELSQWNEDDKTKFQLQIESRRFSSGTIETEVTIYEFLPEYEQQPKETREATIIFKGNLSTLISILKKCNI